ncbi:hypothetical protein SSCG_03606 [Streptomyces clavuligerus]|nr:hypothetical protein SSCG_03606 [Streptomyces clavuligerus]
MTAPSPRPFLEGVTIALHGRDGDGYPAVCRGNKVRSDTPAQVRPRAAGPADKARAVGSHRSGVKNCPVGGSLRRQYDGRHQ